MKQILVLDDDVFYLEYLKNNIILQNPLCRVKVFKCPDDFLGFISQNNKNIDLVVIDRFLGFLDSIDEKIGQSCRFYGYHGPIILMSTTAPDQIQNDLIYSNKMSVLVTINKFLNRCGK